MTTRSVYDTPADEKVDDLAATMAGEIGLSFQKAQELSINTYYERMRRQFGHCSFEQAVALRKKVVYACLYEIRPKQVGRPEANIDPDFGYEHFVSTERVVEIPRLNARMCQLSPEAPKSVTPPESKKPDALNEIAIIVTLAIFVVICWYCVWGGGR